MAGGLAMAACTDGGAGVVQTGPLGAEPDAEPSHPGNPDAHQGSGTPDAKPGSPDARPSSPDASQGGPTCSGAATDVGAASGYAMNTPKKFSGFYVVRDSGGLFAVSSACTHEGATNSVSGGVFYCPRHGAEFSYNGDVLQGPAFLPLDHYAMCILSNGNVGVQTSNTVSASTRLAV